MHPCSLPLLVGLIKLAAAVLSSNVTASTYIPLNFTAPTLRQDNGSYGPALEVTHYFYDQWPIGLAIHAASQRQFVCYTRGTANYTLGVVTGPITEAAYPNITVNSPPGGLANLTTDPVTGSSLANYFISVQALYITGNTLWVLDTGRPTVNSSILYARPGGPKLVSIDLTKDVVNATYTFPATVHYPDSYLNDVRFDFTNGSQIAYLVDPPMKEGTDSSFWIWSLEFRGDDSIDILQWNQSMAQCHLILVNHSIRSRKVMMVVWCQIRLDICRKVSMELLYRRMVNVHESCFLWPSADSIDLYYAPLTSVNLYRIRTEYLKANPSFLANQAAANAVEFVGQKGGETNGFESDSNGLIYMSVPEHDAIYYYNPDDLQVHGLVQDPRILWADSLSVATDGYIYFTINQLPFQSQWNNGTDYRTYPGVIFRAQLPNGGTKISTLGY